MASIYFSGSTIGNVDFHAAAIQKSVFIIAAVPGDCIKPTRSVHRIILDDELICFIIYGLVNGNHTIGYNAIFLIAPCRDFIGALELDGNSAVRLDIRAIKAVQGQRRAVLIPAPACAASGRLDHFRIIGCRVLNNIKVYTHSGLRARRCC